MNSKNHWLKVLVENNENNDMLCIWNDLPLTLHGQVKLELRDSVRDN